MYICTYTKLKIVFYNNNFRALSHRDSNIKIKFISTSITLMINYSSFRNEKNNKSNKTINNTFRIKILIDKIIIQNRITYQRVTCVINSLCYYSTHSNSST